MRRSNLNKSIGLLLAVLLTQSCTLQPRFELPEVDVPDQWREQTNDIPLDVNIDWWEQFDDKVLNDLIYEAINYNYDLSFAIARVQEYCARLVVAESALYPQLNLATSATRNEASRTTVVPAGTSRYYSLYQFALNASYQLDLFGQLNSLADASLAQYLSQVENRRGIIITLVTGVANAYFQLLQYDEQLKISRDTVKSRIESYKIAKDRFEGGLTSELEVKQAESEVYDAQAQAIDFELNIELQENLLSILIGKNPRAIPRGSQLVGLELPVCIPEGLPSDVIAQRPDIRAAEHQIIAANANIGAARALLFPQLSLTGVFGFSSFQFNQLFVSDSRTWLYGINGNQAIFTGGNITGQIEVAEAQKCEAIAFYQQTILQAFREVNDALVSHQKAIEMVKVQKERVKVLSDYLYLATLQYNNGETDYLNVLDAQRNLFNAQLDLAQAKGNTFITIVNIYKALGGGWVFELDDCIS